MVLGTLTLQRPLGKAHGCADLAQQQLTGARPGSQQCKDTSSPQGAVHSSHISLPEPSSSFLLEGRVWVASQNPELGLLTHLLLTLHHPGAVSSVLSRAEHPAELNIKNVLKLGLLSI